MHFTILCIFIHVASILFSPSVLCSCCCGAVEVTGMCELVCAYRHMVYYLFVPILMHKYERYRVDTCMSVL